MSYGLFRGLNEGYKTFRGRQDDIRHTKEFEAESERRKAEEARRVRHDERLEEEYQYGITRRSAQEQVQETAQKMADLTLEEASAQFKEWKGNTTQRKEMSDLALQTARKNLDNSGIQYDLNKISLRAAEGAEKYRQWKVDFMRGGSVSELVKKFNTDKDDTNNVKAVTGDESKGWQVEFENGDVVTFPDRTSIEEHLEFMADPGFHQTYLLNSRKLAADTASAVSDLARKNSEFMFKLQKEWDDNTYKSTDRLFGKIKEGLVDFGEPGAAKVSAAINSIVNEIGAASGYKLVHAAVVDDVARLADNALDLDPAATRQRAMELYEGMPDSEFPGGEKPEEGDEGYETYIKNLMTRDAENQITQFREEVLPKYFTMRNDGNVTAKPDALSRGDNGNTITDLGLERPGEKTPEPTTPEPQAAMAPQQRDVMPVDRETTGGTIVLTGKSLVKEKAKEYGLKGKGMRPKRATAAQKKKISRDFDLSFASMTKAQQGAWFKEFGRYLDDRRQLLAKETIGGNTSVASR